MNGARSIFRGLWRLIQPLRSMPVTGWWRSPASYGRFLTDWKRFRDLGGRADFSLLAPIFADRGAPTQLGRGGAHYFFQDIWALKHLAAFAPDVHHDIGSRLDGFVGQATAVCPVVYWDIRPPGFDLPDLQFRHGDILNLPLESGTLKSLSCLHVAEHVGLGRYGDTLNPEGTTLALKELSRVLAVGGRLLFSIPVGREETWFNAQRIWPPQRPIEICRELRLLEFSAVDDFGTFREKSRPSDVSEASYACGLYLFEKPGA